MKYIYNYIIAFYFFISLIACSNPLKEKVSFNVDVDKSYISEGKIIVKTGEALQFNFDGDPDFMTFYSGEPGAEYAKREQTESSKDDITSSLEFDIHALYGDCEGSLSILLSTDFRGLVKDFDVDKKNVQEHDWLDISEQCDIPVNVGEKNKVSVKVPLDDYLDKEITIALHYHPKYTGNLAQSKWIFTDFKIVNTDKKTKIKSDFGVSNMGFLPLYITLPVGVKDHYEFNTTGKDKEGMWNFSKQVSSKIFEVHSTGKGVDIEQESWLIFQSLKTNVREPDKGLSIKNIQVYLDNYTHTYLTAGEYDVVFIATNSNYEHNSRIVKTLKVFVKDEL